MLEHRQTAAVTSEGLRERLYGALLFARARVSTRDWVALSLSLFACVLLQGHSFVAPVVPWSVQVLTTPLAPAVPAACVVVLLRRVSPALDTTLDVERHQAARAFWVAFLLVAGVVTCAVVATIASGGRQDAAVSARSYASFFGLEAVGASLWGVETAWIAPACVLTAHIYFGRTADQVPLSWAWILSPAGSLASWCFAFVIAASAVTLYILRDTAGETDERT
ncbi:hypothetical protein [Luteimicrobium album]|nr:hypothetical protein [Luteimicrobium album]